MIKATRLYWAILLIAFLIVGGAITWLIIIVNFSQKTPYGATQVLATQPCGDLAFTFENLQYLQRIKYGINS